MKKLLVLILILLPLSSRAQELYSYYLLKQELKVITATKESESYLKVPRYMRVITREEIEELGVKNLFELLDYLPEFYYWRSYFGLNAVGAFGVEQSYLSEKIQVLVNGVPVYDPSNNSPFSVNSLFPLSNVKKVEIVYGPLTSLYGFNTSLAVINLITFTPSDKPKVTISKSTGNDSYASFFVPFKVKNFSGVLSADYAEERSPHREYTDPLKKSGIYSAFRKNFDYYLNLNHSSGFYLNAYGVNRDETFPATITKLVTDGNSYANRKAYVNRVGFKKNNEKWNLNVFASYNWFYLERGYNLCPFNHPYCSALLPHELLSVEERYVKDKTVGATLSFKTQFGKLLLGADYEEADLYKTRQKANFLPATATLPFFTGLKTFNSMKELSDEEKILPEHFRSSFSPYFQFFFSGEKYSALLNVKWSRINDLGNHWSSSISLMRRFKNSSLKLNVGRAIRLPSFEEMYLKNNSVLSGNPHLKVEKADSLIPSYEYFGKDFSFRLMGYLTWYRNFIYKRQITPYEFKWDNAGSTVRVRGLIASFKKRLNENFELELGLGRIFSVKGVSSDYLDYPKKKATARIGYSSGKLTSNLITVAYSRLPSGISGFARVDWNLTYRLSESEKLSLKVNNLLNRKYRFSDGVPGVERTLWLELQLSY